MPTTTNFAFRYPALGEAPNVPLDMQELATDVDTSLNTVNVALDGRLDTLETDTGWVAVPLNTTNFAAVTGYPLQSRVLGGKYGFIRGLVQWNSGVLAGLTIATLAVGHRPAANTWLPLSLLVGSKALAMPLLNASDGRILVPSASYYSGAPAAGDLIDLTGAYLLG